MRFIIAIVNVCVKIAALLLLQRLKFVAPYNDLSYLVYRFIVAMRIRKKCV